MARSMPLPYPESMTAEDRREHARQPESATLHLMWEQDGAARQARARVVDVSPAGIGFRTSARLRPGSILYCASPALGLCTRAVVSHAGRSLFTTTAGARFLLSF
jgi:hypothetical protein